MTAPVSPHHGGDVPVGAPAGGATVTGCAARAGRGPSRPSGLRGESVCEQRYVQRVPPQRPTRFRWPAGALHRPDRVPRCRSVSPAHQVARAVHGATFSSSLLARRWMASSASSSAMRRFAAVNSDFSALVSPNRWPCRSDPAAARCRFDPALMPRSRATSATSLPASSRSSIIGTSVTSISRPSQRGSRRLGGRRGVPVLRR